MVCMCNFKTKSKQLYGKVNFDIEWTFVKLYLNINTFIKRKNKCEVLRMAVLDGMSLTLL